LKALLRGNGVRALLAVVAVAGVASAWWLYPVENRYSILRCTISYLGSPDAGRNPEGWRFYQVGMTSLIVLMLLLLGDRHRRGRRGTRGVSGVASYPLFVAMGLLLLSVWIPDSRSGDWFGMTSSKVHTRLAILAIPVMGLGLVLDTVGAFRDGMRFVALWPAHLFAALAGVGFWQLAAWERKCRADPTLPHWPGDGLHSTPLWEWILFVYLMGHIVWMARRGLAGGTGQGS
jgi:hypothetical protein